MTNSSPWYRWPIEIDGLPIKNGHFTGVSPVIIQSMAISGTDLLEVPTICKAYFSGLCKGIYPQNMALYGTNVPPF